MDFIFSESKKVKALKSQVIRLRFRCQHLARERCKTPQHLINHIYKYAPPSIAQFFKGQILNCIRSSKGRRYGVQERKFALAIYYHSPKAYRFLSKHFILPHCSAIRRWLRKISLKVGWSELTLTVLKKKSESLPKEETLCGIGFDSISLKESLHFDQVSDSVIGMEGFGENGSSGRLANHALVFLVKGLVKKWKMVLGYFVYSGGLDHGKLKMLYLEAIKKVQNVRFKVMSTVTKKEYVVRYSRLYPCVLKIIHCQW